MSDSAESHDLTAAEKHLLSRILNEDSSGTLMFELSYLIPASVLVGVGLWTSSHAAFVSAFAIVLTFRVWVLQHDRRSSQVLKSAVRKVCERSGLFAER